jgi:anaerobic selenocysteine-containing dehydrogenase
MYAYQEDPGKDPRYPLSLISPATNRTISSYLGHLYRERFPLEIHPDDAAPRGIANGDEVRVWNDLGEVRVTARLTRDLKPGVVLLSKGLWSHQTLSGTTANALAPDTLTDLGASACFNDARVEVARGSTGESPGTASDSMVESGREKSWDNTTSATACSSPTAA